MLEPKNNRLSALALVLLLLVLVSWVIRGAPQLSLAVSSSGVAALEPNSSRDNNFPAYLQSLPPLPPAVVNQTLRYDGTRWVPSSNLVNDGLRVGIGLNNPTERLEVNGNINLSPTSAGGGSLMVGGNRFLHSYPENSKNIFLGFESGNLTTTGSDNIGIGSSALSSNTTGARNVAIGRIGLFKNTTGSNNTVLGFFTANDNTSGSANVAIGYGGLHANTTGDNNVSMGFSSLGDNTTGNNNVAIGFGAGSANVTGNNLTFLGSNAGFTGTSDGLVNATAVGYNAQVTESNSLVLGATGKDQVKVGIGTTAPSAELEIVGELKVSGVSDGGIGKLVCVKPNGALGTCSSDPIKGGCECN